LQVPLIHHPENRGGIQEKMVLYRRKKNMKKLSSKKKILQIRMLNKNIQKIKLRKNKRVKDEKKAAERERKLPRNR
jgi:hypothetical protein